MNKELFEALEALEKEKGINPDAVLQEIGKGIIKGFEQIYGEGSAKTITIEVDKENQEVHVYHRLEVVDEVENEFTEISLDDAKLISPDAEYGDLIRNEIDPKDFTRTASATVKSMIRQSIRTEESKTIKEFFTGQVNRLVTGKVIRILPNGYNLNLGRTVVFLAKSDMIPGENFYLGESVKVYVAEVRDPENETRGGKKGRRRQAPYVVVSRTKPGMLRALFAENIPEIKDGIVEVYSVAREPGVRAKVAVLSNDPDVDPIGSCIGVDNTRLGPICEQLHKEKIDLVLWDENPARFVQNALAPAKVSMVMTNEDQKTALAIVDESELSLAIGLKGINAKLAARLTRYKIDIKTEADAREQGLLDEYDEEFVEEAVDQAEPGSPEESSNEAEE